MSGSSFQPTFASRQFNEYTIAYEGNAIACILTGVYLTIVGANLILLRKKRYKLLLLYSIVQLILTILYSALGLYGMPGQCLWIFNIPNSITAGWSVGVVIDVAFVLNTWISDAFLLYRCYIVCQGKKYALACPVLLYIAVVGSSTLWLIFGAIPKFHTFYQPYKLAYICYYSCSAAMTICASGLISVRLWMHRRAISRVLGPQRGAFYLSYIAMTLESALLYMIFAIIALAVLNSPLEMMFIPVFGIIQAIAPSLIIFRIACGISFETDENLSMAIGSIHFASSDPQQTTTHPIHQDISDGSGAMTSQYNSGSSTHEIRREEV